MGCKSSKGLIEKTHVKPSSNPPQTRASRSNTSDRANVARVVHERRKVTAIGRVNAAGQSDSWNLRSGIVGMASQQRQNMVKVHEVGSHIRVQDIYDGVPEFGDTSRAVGQGGTASVFRVKHRITGEIYALKVVDLRRFNSDQRDMLIKEIGIVKMLDHPNTIRVVEIFQLPDVLYEVMELCTGGDIGHVLTREPGMSFSEHRVRPYVAKMIRAVAYLHANELVHRDIKLDNFIFTSRSPMAELKIIDFGLSRQFFKEDDDHLSRTTGTPAYMAPELIMHDYGKPSDIWSLGVTIFIMVTGTFPFDADNHLVKRQILNLSKSQEGLTLFLRNKLEGKGLSSQFCDFLMSMFRIDPSTRATAVEALNHGWLRGRGKKFGNGVASVAFIEKNFSHFRQLSALQQSAFVAVGVGLRTADLTELSEVFQDMDTNKDGVVSFDEFKRAMERLTGESEKQLRCTFDSVDQDQSGVIKYSEFIAAAIEHRASDLEDAVEAAFYRLDVSDTGTISMDDLKQVLPPMSEEALIELMDKADPNKDGVLDLNEFKTLMELSEDHVERIRSNRSNLSNPSSTTVASTPSGNVYSSVV